MSPARFSRRQFLIAGGTTTAVLAAGGIGLWRELLRGTSPPKYPHLKPGPLVSGSFYSRHRHQEVGWTISYPPGHSSGSALPVSLVLHGYDANHETAFNALYLQDAQAQLVNGHPIPPIALAAVDGGNTYWHRRADGDDPVGMLVREFLPLLHRRGLVVEHVDVLGWSMGGYGALLLGETHPHLIRRIAAESPAIWPSYWASQGANPTAFDSAADWQHNSVLGHIRDLMGIPVRVDCGESDPFLFASQDLARLLPAGSVHFEPGGHSEHYWEARGPAQLRFLTA
jgi:enterochelin esterase-like enzyme